VVQSLVGYRDRLGLPVGGPDGEVGRGLTAYDAEDAAKIMGKSSSDILLILGFSGRVEMVHRDDLVMGRA